MKDDYWLDFWRNYASTSADKDPQSQVLRTCNKEPISEDLWAFTLNQLDEIFKVAENDSVLDLCAGNGLLAKHFHDKGATVTAVDISKELLSSLSKINGITTIVSDIRKINFEINTFDKIIIYAGIQYLNYKESIELFTNIYDWLKPNGVVFVGDIPDLAKRWVFFNDPSRRQVYFDNTLSGKAIVGTWYERAWFEYMAIYVGFKSSSYFQQDDKHIYSNFRFDLLVRK
jgi:2-polyprenyl-3-methyl-5-hydroxy-6-metoxy-1,4-benzoquinol methylase